MAAICLDAAYVSVQATVTTTATSPSGGLFSVVSGSSLISQYGEMNFSGLSEPVAITLTLLNVDDVFLDSKNKVIEFADDQKHQQKKPVPLHHHQFRDSIKGYGTQILTFCYKNEDNGGNTGTPHKYRISKYGINTASTGSPTVVNATIDPAIDNGTNGDGDSLPPPSGR
jgi:hypothetical protein